jgi:transcriptional regulator with XRE-family HTH domain
MFTHDRQELGARIRSLRDGEGLSMRAFSNMVGMNKDHLNAIEKGRKSPTFDTLMKIAGGFNLSLSELVAGIGPQPNAGNDEPPAISYHGTKL